MFLFHQQFNYHSLVAASQITAAVAEWLMPAAELAKPAAAAASAAGAADMAFPDHMAAAADAAASADHMAAAAYSVRMEAAASADHNIAAYSEPCQMRDSQCLFPADPSPDLWSHEPYPGQIQE